MNDHYNRILTLQDIHYVRSIENMFVICGLYLTLMNLSCQNEKFQVLTCQISETTESIELKLSGIIEDINKLAVLKFQSNLIRLGIKFKIRNSG